MNNINVSKLYETPSATSLSSGVGEINNTSMQVVQLLVDSTGNIQQYVLAYMPTNKASVDTVVVASNTTSNLVSTTTDLSSASSYNNSNGNDFISDNGSTSLTTLSVPSNHTSSSTCVTTNNNSSIKSGVLLAKVSNDVVIDKVEVGYNNFYNGNRNNTCSNNMYKTIFNNCQKGRTDREEETKREIKIESEINTNNNRNLNETSYCTSSTSLSVTHPLSSLYNFSVCTAGRIRTESGSSLIDFIKNVPEEDVKAAASKSNDIYED